MTALDDPLLQRGGLREFVRNEPNWKIRLGDRWVYQGRIHSTDRAIVTHFKYEDKDFADNDPPHTKDVVAKIYLRQPPSGSRPNGYPEGYTGFSHEGELLQLLSGFYAWEPYDNPDCIPDRPHNIVRHYRNQIVPPADEGVPLGNRNVVSLLEYCPGVVVAHATDHETRYYDLEVFDCVSTEHVQEIDIWLIFKQFARMILMLDSGSEIPRDSRQRRSFWESEKMEMCHYDIHPGNILIGYKNYEKDRVPVLKLCDFGDTIQVPRYYEQQRAGRYSFPNQLNGRPGYRAPEQVIGETEHVHPFHHGTCSNIFQFANIIRLLMHGGSWTRHELHPEDPAWCDEYFGEYSSAEPRTYGYSLTEGRFRVNRPTTADYSPRLIKLVQDCMMEKPNLRIRPLNLFHYVHDFFLDCDEYYNDPDFPGPQEGDLHREKQTFDSWAPIVKYPCIHSVFALAQLAPPHFRTPQHNWESNLSANYDIDDFAWPPTPRCITPKWSTAYEYSEDIVYGGDDLPEHEYDQYPRSQPQVPARYAHGPPKIDQRPSVNIPDRRIDVPGGIARNLGLLKYYDRLGHMWMGEENYWKMMEAGLDPETYNWGMKIPNPETDKDETAMSGSEILGSDGDGG